MALRSNKPRGCGAIAAVTAVLALALAGGAAAEDEPLALARDGYFYVGGKTTTVDGRPYVSHQMYVEVRIPAQRTRRYPVVMVHGGTMSGTNYTGTPDGREGWAQLFARAGYAVYIVDQVGKGRSPYFPDAYGPSAATDMSNNQARYVAQEKYDLWPQAHLHTQWPGGNGLDSPTTQQLVASQIPSIKDFHRQQELNVAGLIALVDKIGPAILLVHSQAGAFVWPVADARPNAVK